ncbi:MAG: hypothetical protein ACON5H_06360 [Akkermansiaceae bacterium]
MAPSLVDQVEVIGFLLTGAFWLPFLAAALHPLLSWCVQSGSAAGVRLGFIVGVANLLTAIICLLYLRPENLFPLHGKDWWAVGNGLIFFCGQWFSIQSVKSGDIAVHSSALGIKLLIVGFFSFLVGLEAASLGLIAGVILAVIAVYLVAGGSREGWLSHRRTVGLTVVACLFFGMNDFLTGWQAREIGAARWLCLMLGTSGVVSLGLLARRVNSFGVFREKPKIDLVVIGAGLALGLQALLVNLALSGFGEPTQTNVIYSSRGVLAVAFLWLIGRKSDPFFRKKQLCGSILMVLALAMVVF